MLYLAKATTTLLLLEWCRMENMSSPLSVTMLKVGSTCITIECVQVIPVMQCFDSSYDFEKLKVSSGYVCCTQLNLNHVGICISNSNMYTLFQ